MPRAVFEQGGNGAFISLLRGSVGPLAEPCYGAGPADEFRHLVAQKLDRSWIGKNMPPLEVEAQNAFTDRLEDERVLAPETFQVLPRLSEGLVLITELQGRFAQRKGQLLDLKGRALDMQGLPAALIEVLRKNRYPPDRLQIPAQEKENQYDAG